MNLALITVNYHSRDLVDRLLRCLDAQTQKHFTITVIDNDEDNRGFAGGCNAGIRQALAQGAEWVLLINPDTTVEPDFIASLRVPAEPSIAGIPLREGGHVVAGGIVRWLRSTLSHTSDPKKATYVIGAGMLIHREVFAKIGMLDERYFLYFEDADFSARARRAGVPVHFLSGPVIEHGVSQSTKSLGSAVLLRYHARNALLFNWNNGPWWVKIALPFWSFFAMIKQFLKLLLMPARRPQSRAILAGILDFYVHRFGKIHHHRD